VTVPAMAVPLQACRLKPAEADLMSLLVDSVSE
jgi:hypothetical protein